MNPAISVVMPAHNAVEFVVDAVESILDQSFDNFELVVVDDGSDDGTREHLEDYARRDGRVRVLSSSGRGFVDAVMTGVQHARGPWIARMDADDRSHPERLAAQHAYLSAHPSIRLLGSTARVIWPGGGPASVIRYPLSDALIKLCLAAHTTFAHGSVMMRRNDIMAVGGYQRQAFPAEDYDLWCRMALNGVVMANLDQPLYEYRLSPAGTSRRRAEEQKARAREIGRRYVRELHPRPSVRDARRSALDLASLVELGGADPRSLRRASHSLLDAAPRWMRRSPGTGLACGAAAMTAERAFRRAERSMMPSGPA